MAQGLKQKLTILITAQDEVSGQTTKINSRLKSVAKSAAAMTRKFLMAGAAIGAAVAGMVAKATKEFANFETSMRNVWTLLPIGEQAFQELSNQVLEMSKSLPQTPEELGASLYDIISAGVTDTAESMMVLEASAKAGVAGLTDAKNASKGAISIMNAFGKSAGEIPGIFDAMFKTVKVGITTFPEISESIGRTASAFGAAGASVEEMLGSLAFLTKMGLNTQQSVTRLNRAMLGMVKRSDQFKAMGAAVFDASGKFRGMEAVITDLRKQLKGMTTEQQLKAIQKLVPQQRAAQAIQAMVVNYDKFSASLKEVADNHGATEAAAAKQLESTANKVKLLQNQFNNLLIQSGAKFADVLLPKIEKFTERFKEEGDEWIEKFVNFGTKAIEVFSTLIDWADKFLSKAADIGARLGKWIAEIEIFNATGGEAGKVMMLQDDAVKRFGKTITDLLKAGRFKDAIDLILKMKPAIPPEKWKEFGMALAFANQKIADQALAQERLNRANKEGGAKPPTLPPVPGLPEGETTGLFAAPDEKINKQFKKVEEALDTSLMSQRESIIQEFLEREAVIEKFAKQNLDKSEEFDAAFLANRKLLNKQLAELDKQNSSDFLKLWENTLDRFASGFSAAIASAIVSQEDFAASMTNLVNSIKTLLIQTIVEVAVKKLIAAALSGNVAAIIAVAGGALLALNSLKNTTASPGSNQEGGFIQRSGLAMVHEGEQIIPAGAQTSRPGQRMVGGGSKGGPEIKLVLNNPVFMDGKSGADAMARELKPALDRLAVRGG
jgi:TP901 family phage tail tape measure protein